MVAVVGFVHREGGSFGYHAPDFPGATTVASSLEEVKRKAGEMLVFHVRGMIEDGDPIPAPRTWPQVRTDPACAEDVAEAEEVVILDLPDELFREVER